MQCAQRQYFALALSRWFFVDEVTPAVVIDAPPFSFASSPAVVHPPRGDYPNCGLSYNASQVTTQSNRCTYNSANSMFRCGLHTDHALQPSVVTKSSPKSQRVDLVNFGRTTPGAFIINFCHAAWFLREHTCWSVRFSDRCLSSVVDTKQEGHENKSPSCSTQARHHPLLRYLSGHWMFLSKCYGCT